MALANPVGGSPGGWPWSESTCDTSSATSDWAMRKSLDTAAWPESIATDCADPFVLQPASTITPTPRAMAVLRITCLRSVRG